MKKFLFATLIAVSVSTHAAAQPAVTEEQVRAAAASAAVKGERGFHNAFRDEIRKLMPDYSANNVTLVADETIDIWLMGPISRFQQLAADAVRKMEPLDKVVFPPGAVLTVYPKQMGGPNVQKVVISRAGTIIEPVTGGFIPMELSNALGAKVTLGAGHAAYPMSAFAPGAVVTVTIIPERGGNITKTLKDGDLKKVR